MSGRHDAVSSIVHKICDQLKVQDAGSMVSGQAARRIARRRLPSLL